MAEVTRHLAGSGRCAHTGAVKELTVRLDALDPEAGAALRVISYFDSLVAHGAGLNALLRAAAVLTAGPAALVDEERSLRVRVDAQGQAGVPAAEPDPAWPTLAFGSTGSRLWLEYAGPARAVDAVVLERAAAAIEPLLLRTRGRRDRPGDDEASVEVLVDPHASREARDVAARRLGLPRDGLVRAVALPGGRAAVRVEGDAVSTAEEGERAGTGPAVPLDGLPESWRQARLALRLTAAGTPGDPGPRTVRADEAGSLLLLAATVDADTPAPADVAAVEAAAQTAPWLLPTLDAVARSTSVRAAATRLRVHHSTAQERAARASRALGWDIDAPEGRLRLQLALVVRRLRAAPPA